MNRIASRLILCAALLALGTLVTHAHTSEVPQSMAFVCPDGERFEAEFRAERVRLHLGSGVFILHRANSEAGTRYTNDDISLWMRGNEASLERSGLVSHRACQAVTQHS